jgi:phage tail-like protein
MANTSKYQTNIGQFSTIGSDPLRNFRFRADFSVSGPDQQFDSRITNFSGGFQNISGLNVSVQPIAYREGGFNTTAHQIPGMTNFSPLQFTRGALFGNDQAITWMRGLFAVTAGEGLDLGALGGANSKNFRCNIKIYVMEHPNTDSSTNVPRMGFIARNAWPTSVAYSDLNAVSNELMFETITFVHEGLSVFYTNPDGTPADSTYKLSGV